MTISTEPNNLYLEFLSGRTQKLFYRMPYQGNAGDSLIQFATQRILDDLGIRTTVDPNKAEVILVPGGNPTMWPSIGLERWQILWARHPQAEFVIGPAGFRKGYSDWATAVNSSGKMVTGLFARDPHSYENLIAAGLRPNISKVLSHDPALYLRDSGWIKAHRQAASAEYDLAAFRDDHEADLRYNSLLRRVRSALPWGVYVSLVRRGAHATKSRNIKLAKKLGKGQKPLHEDDVSRQRFEVFVETIRAANAVHTDRLHVLLLAAMLGKKVFAYPTAHGKLEGVYRHSLAGWADVTLVTDSG